MKRKHRKAREKRWMTKRNKEFHKQRFAEGFRNWFVQRGVIKSDFSQTNQEMSNLLNASKKLKAISENLTMRVTAPLAGMGAMAVKTFASFEDSMHNVQAVSASTARSDGFNRRL